jgi:hypothetical protein
MTRRAQELAEACFGFGREALIKQHVYGIKLARKLLARLRQPTARM